MDTGRMKLRLMYKTSSGRVPFRWWSDLEIPNMDNRNLFRPLTSGGTL